MRLSSRIKREGRARRPSISSDLLCATGQGGRTIDGFRRIRDYGKVVAAPSLSLDGELEGVIEDRTSMASIKAGGKDKGRGACISFTNKYG